MTLARKGRCQNQLKRRQAGPERLLGNGHGRLAGGGGGGGLRAVTITTSSAGRLAERAAGSLCDVHFLPLVVGTGDGNRTQRLRCVGESTIRDGKKKRMNKKKDVNQKATAKKISSHSGRRRRLNGINVK